MEMMLRKTVFKLFVMFLLSILMQSFGNQFGYLPKLTYAYKTQTYEPIRIHPYFSKLEYELDQSDLEVLTDIIRNVIIYVRKTLSVIRHQGELLLERDACQSSWTTGRNVGKCAAIKKGYSGEFCENEFLIPDDHLEAFYTWTNDPLPYQTLYTDGTGVYNSDYILYVQARTTKPCMTNYEYGGGNELLAYASYCKLGKNDRPIAGYINFCPSHFKKNRHDRRGMILTTLHEIFHALGFSKDLFLRYRDCSQMDWKGECPEWGFPILRQNENNFLLLTPAVVTEMQKHFYCDKPDFGGPLTSKNGVLQSHWNATILPGSIMNSKLEEPSNTFVDPITLAVFEDTGWYKVNKTNGDRYMIAKASGCDVGFGVKKPVPINLCTNLLQESTCDRVDHKSMINCSDIQTGKYFTPESVKLNCDQQFSNSVSTVYSSSQSPSGQKGRCLYHLSQNITQGKCYLIRCLQNGQVWIKVDATNWLDCPLGEKVEIPYSDVTVICPSYNDKKLFCDKETEQLYLQDLVQHETTTTPYRPLYVVTQNHHQDLYSYGRDRNRTSVGISLHNLSVPRLINLSLQVFFIAVLV